MAQFLPLIEYIGKQENALQLKAHIDAELLAFKGHFPEFAVFPGVAQIAMIRQLVTEYFAHLGEMYRAEQLRFQNFVLPNQEIFISLECVEQTVTFKITNAAQQAVASGRLLFNLKG